MSYLTDTSLDTIVCCSCGITFAMPSVRRRELLDNGGGFHCPNGHAQTYGKGRADKLEEQLAQKQRELTAARCETTAEKLKREKAETELSRHKRRTKNGVCPCCQRSFLNLKRHLATKHPDFKP
jgi:hypothetical protein